MKEIQSTSFRCINSKDDSLHDGETAWVLLSLLSRGEPYSSARWFDKDRAVEIRDSILQRGFDTDQPVTVDIDTWLIVRGNHRFEAVTMAGLEYILVTFKQFSSKREGFEYACSDSRGKRDESHDWERYNFVLNLYSNATYEKMGIVSSRKLAEMKDQDILALSAEYLGISANFVKKILVVIKNYTPEELSRYRKTEKWLNRVYEQLRKEKQSPKILKNRIKRKDDNFYIDFPHKKNFRVVGINPALGYEVDRKDFNSFCQEIENLITQRFGNYDPREASKNTKEK